MLRLDIRRGVGRELLALDMGGSPILSVYKYETAKVTSYQLTVNGFSSIGSVQLIMWTAF
jgi:hypothetical protein